VREAHRTPGELAPAVVPCPPSDRPRASEARAIPVSAIGAPCPTRRSARVPTAPHIAASEADRSNFGMT